MLKRLTSLLLALMILLGCAGSAFATELEAEPIYEEEIAEAPELTPVEMTTPPYGNVNYNWQAQTPQKYSIWAANKLRSLTFDGITSLFGFDGVMATMLFGLATNAIASINSSSFDPYANNEDLYVTHTRYTSSTYTDSVKIVKIYHGSSSRNSASYIATVTYYIMYSEEVAI